MRAAHQIDFVRDLTASILSEITDKILNGSIPEEWDGHELRELLADKFDSQRSESMKDKRSKRAKDYANTIAITTI